MLYLCNLIWLGMCVYPAAFEMIINRQGVQYQSLFRTTMYQSGRYVIYYWWTGLRGKRSANRKPCTVSWSTDCIAECSLPISYARVLYLGYTLYNSGYLNRNIYIHICVHTQIYMYM